MCHLSNLHLLLAQFMLRISEAFFLSLSLSSPHCLLLCFLKLYASLQQNGNINQQLFGIGREGEEEDRGKYQMKFEFEQQQLRRSILLKFSEMDQNIANVLK